MFYFKLESADKTLEGPLCHNYSTAWHLASSEVLKLIKNNWLPSNDNWNNIRKPFNVELLKNFERMKFSIIQVD